MNRKEVTKTFMMISNRKNPLVSMDFTKIIQRFNPLTAKLFNWNFHPHEAVSR